MYRNGFRKGVVAPFLALGIVALAACSGGDAPDAGVDSEAPAEDTVKVGLIQINQQALFFNQMNEGAQEAADELGVDLTIYNSNDDPEAQNEAIANFITQGFDAIVVVAIDVEGIKPALVEAKAAGLYVAAVDAVVDSPDVDVQVGVDNGAAAADIAAWTVENGDDLSKDLGVVGALNSFIQNIRKDDFVAPIEEAGFTVLQTVDGKNVQESALAAAENLLTANSGELTIYATGEPALVGTIAAVRSQGREDSVDVVGWDLTAEVISAIDVGFVKAVVQQDPRTEGYEAVSALFALINGEDVDAAIDVPITIVTTENVDDFRDLFS
jgi:ribose transport system substrate-binding protein